MKLPKYISNEYQLMFGILFPYVVLLNFLIFSETYFTDGGVFLIATAFTLVIKVVAWQLHTLLAMRLTEKYPRGGQTLIRIGFALLLFFLLTALVNTSIYGIYTSAGFGGVEFESRRLIWILVSGVTLNLLATFLHEGVANFEKWKSTLTETEQLKTEYAKSQLEGLKSQVNPHFLFNSINTLSSLISGDPDKAEIFLDEMCKVYRYLLNSEKGEFVTLHTELQFIRSWFYIMKTRYGSAIHFEINVDDRCLSKGIPPLTLQLLVEHILNRNMISKLVPLQIQIRASSQERLELYHSVAAKIKADESAMDKSLENVVNKFRLLELEPVRISDHQGFNVIQIPLV